MTSSEITLSPSVTMPSQKPLNFSIARIMQPDPVPKEKQRKTLNFQPQIMENEQDDEMRIDVDDSEENSAKSNEIEEKMVTEGGQMTENADDVLQRIDSAFKK